jgi:DNA-directed RNA polymerase subunit delta
MLSLKQLPKNEVKEMSFIELAHAILEEDKQPNTFQEMLDKIQGYLEISDAELKQRMIQFYTDLNIDGSFITLGENRWGLRAWYPVEQLEEEVTPAVKAKKKKSKKAVKEEIVFEEEDLEDLDDDEVDFDEDDLDDVVDDLDADIDDDDEDDDDDEEFDDDLVTEDEYDLEEEEDDEELNDKKES